MSSSSADTRDLELFEIHHREGPGLGCYAACQALAVDLAGPDAAVRWPAFTATARLDEHTTELAQALADIATVAILQSRALSGSELLAEQLQTALNDRIVLEQAKGLLAERGRIDIDQAFTALRDYCRATRRLLTETARELSRRLAARSPASPRRPCPRCGSAGPPR